MPEHSSIKLNDILREERKSKLVPLPNDFYDRAAGQIRQLEEEKSRIGDSYSTKYAIVEAELKTAREAIENIINRRTTKIIREARYDAELSALSASSKQRDKQDYDSMTQEERRLYDRLLELMTEYRTELLDKIFTKKEMVRGLHPVFDSQQAPAQENRDKESPEGKKDISKEYIVVRLLKDIPTFVGADGRNCTLANEDVVVLSAVNAKALIIRKAAVQIPVKR